MRGALLALALTVPAWRAEAHAMPNSTVVVEQVSPQSVRLDLSIPLSELAVALGRADGAPVDVLLDLPRYLNQHVGVLGADGQPWIARIEDTGAADGDHPAIAIKMSFGPPPGALARPASLRYDAVTHRVASHYALVYRRVGDQLVPLGRLQSPAITLNLP